MKYLFIFIFFLFSNGFIFPTPQLRRTFSLDVKRKDLNQKFQLYEEKEDQNLYTFPKH